VKVKFLVIGAGITGCTVARLLQLRGEEDVLLLEKEAEPGGLCRTRQVGGHVLDIGGGHFLCSRFPEVYEFVFSHLPRSEFNRFERVSKIELDGEIIDYPIEFNLWQLSPEVGRAFLESCLRAGEVEGRPQPASFEDWIRWKLGDRIADSYMIPYNRKIWGVEPDEMDVDWLSKVPRVDTESILASWRDRRADRDRMPSHASFYYPREGGFQRLFDAISASVRGKIWLSRPVTRLERRGDLWRVNDEIDAEVVVNTAPWGPIHTALWEDPGLRPSFARLRCSPLVVSLYEEPFEHDWHWCYRPSGALRHHREFFIRNFAPHSAPDGVYRETHLTRWVPGHGEIHVHSNDSAYPIPMRGHAAALRAIREYGAARKLYGVGRWGQHAYYNSDVCIREAMSFVDGL